MSIRTVNLLWEKRIRQTYPVARYALRDDGTLALAVPRPLEARTYDRTLLGVDGASEMQGEFGVETLLKLEMTSQTPDCLGMTSDDLYLFHEGGKNRFLGERRQLFVDAVLSETGHNLFAAFSDIAGSSYALAYGEIGGRVAWTSEMPGALTTLAISRQGNRMAVGTEGGLVHLKDASRRDAWEFGTGEPISALACSQDGVYVAYGTKEGAVGLVGGDGTRKWEAALPGEVISLALSGDGSLCAALCRPRQEPMNVHLACIGSTGQIDWQYASEQNLLGLSLSANGKFLATGARNGTTAVYAVVIGDGAAADSNRQTGRAQAQAEHLAQTGDLRGAWRILEIALTADPADLDLYHALIAQRNAWIEETLTAARTRQEAGEFVGATTLLELLLREEPLCAPAAIALGETRHLRARQLREAAQALAQNGQDDEAEIALRSALEVVPFDSLAIRQELAVLRQGRSQAADTLADQLLSEGKMEEGVAALERAQAIAPTLERAAKLLRAQTAMEFAEGMNAYNAKEYREAVFQFKKALARDPAHAEAKRYLAFAQKFATDTANEALNDRFSRLE